MKTNEEKRVKKGRSPSSAIRMEPGRSGSVSPQGRLNGQDGLGVAVIANPVHHQAIVCA